MKSRVIVGAGDALELACSAWKSAPGALPVERLEIGQDESYYFDLSFLDRYDPAGTAMFAAFDHRFLNFKRLELMGAIKGRGFRMPAFISAQASVAPEARVGENAFVGPGAVIGPDANVQYNAFVGPRCVIGCGADIGPSVWLAAGVMVADKARVGAHTIVGEGVAVSHGVQVGRSCMLERPGVYRSDVPAKTFHLALFEEPVRIFN